MAEATDASKSDGIQPFDVFASIVALFAITIAQPLLDLLGRNAEFFLARAAPALDIVILALALTIIIPSLIALIVLGFRKVHEPTGRVVHGIVLMVLAAILALQIIELTPVERFPAWIEILIAVAVGVLVALGFYQVDVIRSVARYASVAPLAVLGLFLFASPTSQLIFASSEIARPVQTSVDNPVPVVMVVFDEFPVASLIDGDGTIQENVYPNFARLARDGTWYRNATTVQQQTERALPAILTGSDPADGKIPMASDYPFTLFTLLADSYDLRVQEVVTDLCPEYACENTSRITQAAWPRWRTLASDLRVVAGHLFLPKELTQDLPSIDASWSNFSGGEDSDFDIIARFQEVVYDADRRDTLAAFLDGIEPAAKEPRLSFLHALVPHVPWNYLPSGQTYPKPGRAPGTVSPGWGDDEWLVDQAYQQHLVQVQYVDGFVGDMIEKLEAEGLYDDALVVVLADHGVTVRPDTYHRRHATDDTIGDVAAVPLFIKYPHQAIGGVDDYRAETIDVLPTIADVLEVNVPWAVEGGSLLSDQREVRAESQISGAKGVITFGVDGSEARAVAARKIDHFGVDGPFGLAPAGHADLLGLSVADVDVQLDGGVTASIKNLGAYSNLDTDGPSLPAWVNGTITEGAVEGEDLIVAVAINGRIAAVTRSFLTDKRDLEYGALLPPESLLDGDNGIELIVVRGDGTNRTFHQVGQ